MSNKNVLIICQSIHHGNTLKVAKVLAEQLKAEIKKPSEVKSTDIKKYDLIGFGSGMYDRKHHISLFELVNNFES
jgi:flavodoxin